MTFIRKFSSSWRFSSHIVVPIAVIALATITLVAGFAVWAARESDAIALERQSHLVGHILKESFAKIPQDQESVAIWDDTVLKVKGPFDGEWLDNNLGIWMFNYFGHDRTYVLNARDEPIYAMQDGARADSSNYDAIRPVIQPLANALRRNALKAATSNHQSATNASQSPRAVGLVRIERRPGIASVIPIVSDTGRLEQNPGTEYLYVSIRFLDRSFLERLMEQYLLQGARFSWTNSATEREAAYRLRTGSGEPFGFLIWRPERPGHQLLAKTAPVFMAAVMMVAAIIGLLIRHLYRTSLALQASEAQALHLALHDSLTGLPNRALFIDRLEQALAEIRRNSGQLALLCLDLDRFKNVNDTLGHPAGDALICDLGRRLGMLVRQSDTVARLGGDEFAIIERNVTKLSGVEELCSRIIEAIGEPFEVPGGQVFVGVSIGVAVAPAAGLDRSELVRKADIALYRAKEDGQNCFRIFTAKMDDEVQHRQLVETELRCALDGGDQLEVLYQPMYSAERAAVAGVEALVRWKHPTYGILLPADFIPVAEESGLIVPLGNWVLRQACAAAASWPFRTIAVMTSLA